MLVDERSGFRNSVVVEELFRGSKDLKHGRRHSRFEAPRVQSE